MNRALLLYKYCTCRIHFISVLLVMGYLMFGSLQKENISFVSEDSVVLSSGEEAEEEKEEETRYMFMCV